ncbi:hypothetical protein [Streptomyces buecherae]|uniref:Uncharacterized protein n=1 Tax=Streptomyces buecherae TaxID=2763006 RepID=A0A7H8N270_9ACTN|nr:hypothetical protein [Streptomyces buecherae]QKW48594.1 hypothetical protein HUT08_02455 [Streptomyces buecherae]
MDLTRALLRFAARTPHVLIVPVPGADGPRGEVEHAVAVRRWREATGPADTDVLVVAGRPGPEMRVVVADVWRRVPAPRLRVDVNPRTSPADIGRRLDQVPGLLADPHRARVEAVTAASDTHSVRERVGEHHHPAHGAGAPGAWDHAGPARHGAHDAAGHGDHDGGHHDHHHTDMPLPGGLGMAEVAEDRDGLTLDVLRLPLGPVLPDWPAGLVVDVVMQGDVISSAEARFLDGPHAARDAGESGAVVRELDVVARVLAVAGWAGPAARARFLRDRTRAGASRREIADDLLALVRRVRRSRVLHLMLRDLGRDQRVDVADSLRRRLSRIEAHALGRPAPRSDASDGLPVRELGSRLAGAELAAARLLVAALDPRPDAAAAAGPGRAEGVGRWPPSR